MKTINSILRFIHLAAIVATTLILPCRAATLIGPASYLSFSDSAFFSESFDYFHLEDFEDGLLNTPGVSLSNAVGGSFSGFIALPSATTDSVDSDDGAIDGLGRAGRSLTANSNTDGIRVIFSIGVLGMLPTHAGLVWTDGYNQPQVVSFEAFDSVGASLGFLAPTVGDSAFDGLTAEDRFFGVINTSGISAISIRTSSPLNSDQMEIDHIQYGHAVPEPSVAILLPLSTLVLLMRSRRKAL